MAEIVSVLALSHAPGLTGWLDQAPPDQQRRLLDGYQKLHEALQASRPDVIIGFANDHLLNMPVHDTADFMIGTAETWSGPAPWFSDWLNVPPYKVRGHKALAETLVREGAARGIAFRPAESLLFDDNWSVPLHFLTPKHNVALVPIHMNCIVPPLPSPTHCYAVGQAIAEIVRTKRPAGERVAIMATGGLSHDPGGPRYFTVDEVFDRRFLGLLEAGDPDKVLSEITLDAMAAAGDGGTTELLSWIVALGAAGKRPARTLCYEAAVELRCGMGGVVWDMARAAA
jgi:aromatic ring-opening dioxygenase catalytic subunit (LigB family)